MIDTRLEISPVSDDKESSYYDTIFVVSDNYVTLTLRGEETEREVVYTREDFEDLFKVLSLFNKELR